MEMNWRLILGAIVVVVIVASAIIAGFNPSGISGFSIFGNNEPTKDIIISSSLLLKSLDMQFPAEKLIIDLYSQEKTVSIGDQQIHLSYYTTIELENFNGKITTDNGLLTIDAQVDKVLINDVEISQKSGTMKLNMDQVEFAIIDGENAILAPIKYEKASGDISINNDKIYFKVDEENLELGAFKGKLEITSNDFILDGIVDRVLVDGKSKLLIDE